MKRKTIFVFILGAVILTLLSCKKDDCRCSKIRIGALIPLNGTASPQGESGNAALMLAKTDIDKYLLTLDKDMEVELTIKNTATDTSVAISGYHELKENGIRIIIGPYTSSELKAVKPYADRDGVLLISPASVATSLSIAGDNVFRMVPDISSQAEAMNTLLVADGIKAIVPVVRDDIWGNELLTATAEIFTGNGNQVYEPVKYQPGANMATIAASLYQNTSEALASYPATQVGVYMVSYDEGTSILEFFAQNQSNGDVKWYGSSGYAFDPGILQNFSVSAFAAESELTCPVFGFDAAAKPKWEPLKAALESVLLRTPDIYAFAAYDALWLATFTLLKTGFDNDIEAYKTQFDMEAENFYGVTGWTALNDAGDRAWATYDFWGIKWQFNAPVWSLVANYNNGSGILTRY